MKKIMNLNERAAIKTKSIIFAIIVLSSMVMYSEGKNTTEGTLEQTTEKYAIAQSQPAAVAWENGTNTQTAHTQKAMENPEIPAKKDQQAQMNPAVPLNQKGSEAVTTTLAIEQDGTVQDAQPAESTLGSENANLSSSNNLLYLGVFLVLLLAVLLLLKGKAKKEPVKK